MKVMRRCLGRHATVLLPLLALAGGCESEGPAGPAEAIGFARAFGIWTPSGTDTCTKETHDRYATVGPDGYLYPTWHPPVDPASGCTFGHEHGRDPRGSDLFEEVGPIPFGYANQALDTYDPLTPRHEDHVGHKVEWDNDVRLGFSGGAGAVLAVTCDVLVKLHQGTHSRDAFTNNLHELVYHIRCNDGTAMSVTLMAAIGKPGEFVSSCDRERHITVGPASPVNSPTGGGKRAIPDRACVERHILTQSGRSNFQSGLRESWEISEGVTTREGKTIAAFNPYFQVLFPSRYYDPSQPSGVGRPIDLCYEVTASGARAQGGECETSTGNGMLAGIRYDDPRSAFNGVERFVDINSNRIENEDGPDVWYSDPFGNNARTSPFPGSIRQFVAKIDNSGRVGQGPVLGRNRYYGGPGSRAPN